jgi:hypothetical protein
MRSLPQKGRLCGRCGDSRLRIAEAGGRRSAKTKRRNVDRKAGHGRGTSFGDQSAYGSPGSGSTSRVPDHAVAPSSLRSISD